MEAPRPPPTTPPPKNFGVTTPQPLPGLTPMLLSSTGLLFLFSHFYPPMPALILLSNIFTFFSFYLSSYSSPHMPLQSSHSPPRMPDNSSPSNCLAIPFPLQQLGPLLAFILFSIAKPNAFYDVIRVFAYLAPLTSHLHPSLPSGGSARNSSSRQINVP